MIISTSSGTSVNFNKDIFKNSFNECHDLLGKLNIDIYEYNYLISIIVNYYRLLMTREIKKFITNLHSPDDLEDLTLFEASRCEVLEETGFRLKIKYIKK